MDGPYPELSRKSLGKQLPAQKNPPPQPGQAFTSSVKTRAGLEVRRQGASTMLPRSSTRHSHQDIPPRSVVACPQTIANHQDWLQEHCRYQPLIDYFASNPVDLRLINDDLFAIYQEIKTIEGLIKAAKDKECPSSSLQMSGERQGKTVGALSEPELVIYRQYQQAVNRVKALAKATLLTHLYLIDELELFSLLDQAGLVKSDQGALSLSVIAEVFHRLSSRCASDSICHRFTQTVEKYYIAPMESGAKVRLKQLVINPSVLLCSSSHSVIGQWWQQKCTSLGIEWRQAVAEVIGALDLLDGTLSLLVQAQSMKHKEINSDLSLVVFRTVLEKLTEPFLSQDMITRLGAMDWKSLTFFRMKTLCQSLGFNCIHHFAVLMLYAPDKVKQYIPEPIISGIYQSIVAHTDVLVGAGIDEKQLVVQLHDQGVTIKDPEGIVNYWLTHGEFGHISEAIYFLPAKLLMQLDLGRKLSKLQGEQLPPFAVWATKLTVPGKILEYLLPDMAESVLRKTLVALYQHLSMPAFLEKKTTLLQNFGNIWHSLDQYQQQRAAKAIANTGVTSSVDQQAPVFQVINSLFARGQFDLNAGQKTARHCLLTLADHFRHELPSFFQDVFQLGMPQLCQYLLHQCLYDPDLQRSLRCFFPTCIPFHYCREREQWYSFVPLLRGAFGHKPRFSPDLGSGFTASIASFIDHKRQTLRHRDLAPAADRAKSIYGRTILFAPQQGSQRGYRLKLGKKGETQEEFFREMPALNYLRIHKDDGQLPLNSRLPVPVDIFYLSDFASWLQQSSLPPEQQAWLNDHVHIDQQGNALAYLYYTESAEERYEHYVYECGLTDYDRKAALTSLSQAAADMGMLWCRGIYFDNPIPLYHNQERAWQLIQTNATPCGTISDWSGTSTDYPNIAPKPSILRDFGDMHSFQETTGWGQKPLHESADQVINTAARMLQALELLLARILQSEIQKAGKNPDSETARETIQMIEESLQKLYRNFSQEAFGNNVANQFMARINANTGTEELSIVKQAALELTYFLETGDNPRHIQDIIARRVCPLYLRWKTPLPTSRYLTPQGVKVISNEDSVMLLHDGEPLPLVQSTHMKYLLMMLVAALESAHQ